MARQINILFRKLMFKRAQLETMRSPAVPGLDAKPLNLDQLVEQTQSGEQKHFDYEMEPATQRPGGEESFQPGEGELGYEDRDESMLSPYQQQLVFVLHKMVANHLTTQNYEKITYRRIVDADVEGQRHLADEFKVHMDELEESARYYQVTIDEIKKYVSKL